MMADRAREWRAICEGNNITFFLHARVPVNISFNITFLLHARVNISFNSGTNLPTNQPNGTTA